MRGPQRSTFVCSRRGARTARTSGDLSVGVRVTVGQEGCCLDADPRKFGGGTPIRGGIPGTYIPNQPEFGGPILWWNEDGAYIALSGPQLAEDDLVEIAESMSSTATFTHPEPDLTAPGDGAADAEGLSPSEGPASPVSSDVYPAGFRTRISQVDTVPGETPADCYEPIAPPRVDQP